jgi:hypothetical protein
MKKRNMFGLVVSIIMILASMIFAITPVSAQSSRAGRPTPTPDITAPTVNSTIPVNPSIECVNVNSRITATFSETMMRSTITTVTFTLTQGATPVSGKVTYSGRTANFRPAVKLAYSTNYTATITIGATDKAGNPLAVDYVWSFTTCAVPDTTHPTVISTIPVNAAAGVVINGDITATFSEAMDPLTITTDTFILTQGRSHVTGTVTYVGGTATFNPSGNLTANTTYTATITNRARDIAGNRLDDRYVWSFITGAVADTTAPTVNSTIPVNPSIECVNVSGNITANFSEAMNSSTITDVTFTLLNLSDSTTVIGAVTLTTDGIMATFNPDADLAYNTSYNATITTGVQDMVGNLLAANYSWNFTTCKALPANPTAPVLGEAGRFVILAGTIVTSTTGSGGDTAISDGDIGLLTYARSTYGGGLTPTGPAGDFTQLTGGTSFASDDANPSPFPYPLHYSTPVIGAPWTTTGAMLTQSSTDLGIAYTFLAGDPNPGAPTQVCPIELGGLTLTRGVYKTAVDVTIQTGDLHLDAQGDPDSVWIFSIGGTLTTGAPGGNIVLENDAQAKNVYWRTGGITVIGPTTTFYGSVFSWTQVQVLDGADITGSLFGVTEQVTLIGNTVTKAP